MPRIQVAVACKSELAKLLPSAMASFLPAPDGAAISLEPGIRLYKSGKVSGLIGR